MNTSQMPHIQKNIYITNEDDNIMSCKSIILFIFMHEEKAITQSVCPGRVRNLKFATYLKFATCENTNKIKQLW